jgi:hypothetical protein
VAHPQAPQRRFAQALVVRPGPQVLVWSEQDVQQLVARQRPIPEVASRVSAAARTAAAGIHNGRHVGKFHALSEWLRDQPAPSWP